MKNVLLFFALIASVNLFAQVPPTIQNSNFDKIARDGSSDCSCAGWVNKDLGDQAESSKWNSDADTGIKFDDREADIMYQEIAVEANTDYKFTFMYNIEDKGTDDTLSSIEVRILAGSGYEMGYTPTYPTPFNAPSTGYGYTDMAAVEDAANNLADTTIPDPGNNDFREGELYFNSGSNTSIALFSRGVGRDSSDADGKGYPWSNGSGEIRIDSVEITVITPVYIPPQPTVQNSNFDKIARDGSSDCSCAGWTNKDLGDQPESSKWNSDADTGIKFDDREADLMYQEIAVEANSDYRFTFMYNIEDKGTDDTLSSLEVRVLAGSGYEMGYTPTYPTPFDAPSSGYGYTDIAVAEDAANNLADTTIPDPGNNDFREGVLYFNTGSNTSVALLARGVGRDSTDADGKGYPWSNGSGEIRIDSVTLTNITGAPLNNDTTLSDLQIDGTTVTGFASDDYSYDVELVAGTTTVPTVTATPTASSSNADVTPAASLPGTTTVLVTAEDGSEGTYSINFTVAVVILDNDTTLSDLQVDGTTVTGFASDDYSYDVELVAGTTTVPTVTATTTASTSSADVTPAASLPGTTTVLVTAEDGSEGTYSVVFTVADATTISEWNNLDINIYANNNVLYVQSADELLNGRVDVYNLIGKLVASHTINSDFEQFSINSSGLIIVKIVNSNNELVRTLKVLNE